MPVGVGIDQADHPAGDGRGDLQIGQNRQLIGNRIQGRFAQVPDSTRSQIGLADTTDQGDPLGETRHVQTGVGVVVPGLEGRVGHQVGPQAGNK